MNYLDKIRKQCPKSVFSDDTDMAIPHQALSPREILANWVRNDDDTVVHESVDDWHGGDVHPNSIREFEDDFEAMEYVAEMTHSPVSIDADGNPAVSEAESSAGSSAGSSVDPPAAD